MHLIYPQPPHKFCLTIVFDFSWDDCNTQKKLETMVVEKLGARGGGGNKMHCGLSENGEWTIKNLLFSKGCLLMDLELTLL